jgi:hypothetical protein
LSAPGELRASQPATPPNVIVILADELAVESRIQPAAEEGEEGREMMRAAFLVSAT